MSGRVDGAEQGERAGQLARFAQPGGRGAGGLEQPRIYSPGVHRLLHGSDLGDGGVTVATCVPFDPESKGGSEATVRVAKADLVPTDANLLDDYGSWAELAVACDAFMVEVNARPHRVTRRAPVEMLVEEQQRSRHRRTMPLSFHIVERSPRLRHHRQRTTTLRASTTLRCVNDDELAIASNELR